LSFFNQIYPNKGSNRWPIALYLTTAFMAVSIFLHANTNVVQYTHLNPTIAEDSLTATTSKKPSGASAFFTAYSDTIKSDSTILTVTDTLNLNDTVNTAEQSEIQDVITYKAADSIVYDMNTKKMFLYNGSDVKYQKIKLNANLVDFDWTTMTLTAQGSVDSAGDLQGNPVFSDGDKDYKSKKMKYNFKTKKGIVFEVLTKEGEAMIHAKVVKKNEFDEWYGQSARYTTCDLEDHPHFYFKARKVKIVPNKVMVSGTANLWVADVPTPLVLPFGIFPVKQGKRSGIVLPEYGQDAIMGFFLRNGGYYWAVNDYLGLKFTGQVSTNGTVGAGVAAQYAWKYKFTGALSFNYLRSRPANPDLPTARSTNSYSISWTHTQDPRSMPNSSFGASVQIQSADYYKNSLVTDSRILNTSFNSAVNYGHLFAGTPLSLSVSFNHNQNLLNRTITFGLPTIRLAVTRIAPFKPKVASGAPKWYESIGFNYSIEFQNRISTYDSTLFRLETLDKFRMGIKQDFTIDAPFKVFKYLNITPSFQYQERTYFKGQEKSWDPDTVYVVRNGKVDTLFGQVKTDTVWRFNSSRNFSANLSMSTKVTGIFRFKNKYVKAIKHVFTPSVTFSYSPDFGKDFWKYNRYVQSNANGEQLKYSVFEPDALYGVPGSGQVAQLTWTLANNLRMKSYSKKDTATHEQEVGLLDQFGLSGGYNFAADSLRLQPFALSVLSSRILNLINLNVSAEFDPYAVDSLNRKINTFEFSKSHRLLRFSRANISASMSLHSKQKNTPAGNDATPRYMGDYVSYNPNQIYNFDIPWNISLAYNFSITKGNTFNPDTIITVQSINANLDFNITPHWKVALTTGFDITRKQITLTNVTVVRDLHCWELSFAWTPPLPTYPRQQFSILLHPKSNTLKDLKLEKKNSLRDL
jgi:hypothetical protein